MVIKSIIDALLINKSHLLGSICVITFISSINIPQAFAEPLYFDDGGTYYVDYTVSDGISISNGTTLNVQDGASISASATLSGDAILNDSSSTMNMQGGEVNGVVKFSDLNMTGGQINESVYNSPGGDFYMSDGIIDGRLEMLGGNATISGGTITNGIFSEALAYLDISGGTFGSINTISGSYDISGGSFLGELYVGYDRSAFMDITGGSFSGDFEYGAGFEMGSLETAFNFFGDLSLSPPVLIGAGPIGAANIYEATIIGTLLDGSFISQTVTCNDYVSRDPCSGVAISLAPSNVPPTANAGIDQIVNESAAVYLNGNPSFDSDGSIASYSWTQTAGTSVTINDANTATPSFTAPSVNSDTLLMFSLVVTDNNGDTDTASVTITVSNALVVDAGTDQQITEGDIVQLNGLNSLDVSDIIASYLWLQTEGPAVILDDSSSATPSFIAPAVDITTLLVFKLIVSDSNGLQDYDTTFVNVRDELLTDKAPPLDVQLIDTVVSGNVLYQFDTMSDPFFASTNVQWSQINGPAVTLVDANTAIPSFMTPAVSVDSATTFEVRSTNNAGLTVRAWVNVNIPGPASANLAPTANAGNGQVVTEGDTVNLDATASTDDGSIVSYYWQQTGGPMVMLTSIMQAQPSFVVPAIAAVDDGTTLSFEVVVTDDGGFMARRSVTITILDNGISDFADSSDGGGGSMNPLLLVFLLLGFIARTYARLHYRDQTPFSHD